MSKSNTQKIYLQTVKCMAMLQKGKNVYTFV